MTSAPGRRQHPASRRGQGGFSLIEVLITVAISSVIMLPLLAWMTLGYRTQVELTHDSSRTAARNLLSAYFPRDVGGAAAIDTVAADCSASPAPSSGSDRILLSMVSAGTSPRRTVYLVRPVDSKAATLVRRTCEGSTVDDTVVVEDVAASAGSASAGCEALCSARYGRVNLQVTLVDGRGTIQVTASRRIGADQ